MPRSTHVAFSKRDCANQEFVPGCISPIRILSTAVIQVSGSSGSRPHFPHDENHFVNMPYSLRGILSIGGFQLAAILVDIAKHVYNSTRI